MTAKRFTYDSKTVSILKDGEFWLDGNIDTACNHSEICNELNALSDENEKLREVINQNEMIFQSMHDELSRLRSIVKSVRIVKINLEHIWENLEVNLE